MTEQNKDDAELPAAVEAGAVLEVATQPEPPDKIEIELEVADQLRYEDAFGKFEFVPGTQKAGERRRWYVVCDRIFKHTGNDAFYRFRWHEPATESQELDLEHDGSTTLHRVYPSELTVVVYHTKDERPTL